MEKKGVKEKMPKILQEFVDFLYEYKIIGLAVALVMGLAVNQLVKSLVDNIVMPIIAPLLPGGAWQEAVLNLGSVAIAWGKFLSDFIYFLIVAFVIFLIAKFVFKEDKVTKK